MTTLQSQMGSKGRFQISSIFKSVTKANTMHLLVVKCVEATNAGRLEDEFNMVIRLFARESCSFSHHTDRIPPLVL